MSSKLVARGVENNLNEILGMLDRHLGPKATKFAIEIGIWARTRTTTTYYAILVDEDHIPLVGESSYGSASLAEAVADLLNDLHEYIDDLEDTEDDN